jgi:hypothetical protein
MRNRLIDSGLLLGLSVALASGCAVWDRATDPAGTRTFRGRYVSAFETSAFLECGSTADGNYWWVEFTSSAVHPVLDSAVAAHPEVRPDTKIELFLEVDATLSPLGQYGHLGDSSRQLTILTIKRAVPWSDRACTEPASTGDN